MTLQLVAKAQLDYTRDYYGLCLRELHPDDHLLTSVTFLQTLMMSFLDEACEGSRWNQPPTSSTARQRCDLMGEQHRTCLHSRRHSEEMASSQQPSPTQPSDFLETPTQDSRNHGNAPALLYTFARTTEDISQEAQCQRGFVLNWSCSNLLKKDGLVDTHLEV